MTSYDVTKRFVLKGGYLGSAILDFLIFSKPSKSAKIDQEVIKINNLI